MSENLLPVRLQETRCSLVYGKGALCIVYILKFRFKLALNQFKALCRGGRDKVLPAVQRNDTAHELSTAWNVLNRVSLCRARSFLPRQTHAVLMRSDL